MTLRTRITGAGTACIVAGALGLLPAASAHAASTSAAKTVAAPAAKAKPAQTSVPVTGTTTPVGGVATPFAGTLSNLSTSVVNGVLTLTGTLTGTGLPTAGVPISTPVGAASNAGCSILTLDLGAIHLDLLGLVVDLAPVNLDVTAVPGAGNLLGNLLCAVVGLLDGGGPLQGVSALLNRLLTGLGL
ncbi:MAG: ABC transporter substrate-binding protein [Lapillicoccus sp.]